MQLLKNMCSVNSMGAKVERCLRYIRLRKFKEVAEKESGLYYIFIYFVFKIHTFNYESSTYSWKRSKSTLLEWLWVGGKFLLFTL